MKTATTRKARTGDVLDAAQTPIDPNVALVEDDRASVQGFFGNLSAFFHRATELEIKAKEYLADARTLPAPTSADEDARVQGFIKTGNAAQKTAADHWSICQAVSRLHRKLTAKRGMTIDALDQGITIAQGLHNRFVEDQKRKAREQEERERREAEERARQDRERELAILETQALTAEAESPDLSDREERFVDLVYQGFNTPVVAARTCGYKHPETQGPRLMETVKIAQAIEAKKYALQARQQAEAIRRAPISVETTTVRPDIQKVGSDRAYKSAVITDADAFMAAVLDPMTRTKLGIPSDTVAPVQTALNGYAKSLGPLINRWPGIELKTDTRTV